MTSTLLIHPFKYFFNGILPLCLCWELEMGQGSSGRHVFLAYCITKLEVENKNAVKFEPAHWIGEHWGVVKPVATAVSSSSPYFQSSGFSFKKNQWRELAPLGSWDTHGQDSPSLTHKELHLSSIFMLMNCTQPIFWPDMSISIILFCSCSSCDKSYILAVIYLSQPSFIRAWDQ